MNESFRKFKNKFTVYAVIKALVSGISLALLAVGAVLLGLKLSGVGIAAWCYVIIGVGVALTGGVATFFIVRPTDVKLAKRLDAEYGLNEKVQTMVQFSGCEGDMLELQRQDTSARLAAVPKMRIRFTRIWQYAAVAVLAVTVIFTGLFIDPFKAEAKTPDPPVPPPATIQPEEGAWEYTAVMQAAMAEIMQNVQDSALQSAEKDAVYSELYGLDRSLRTVKKTDDMKTAVIATVTQIDGRIKTFNSYDDIYTALSGALSTEGAEPEDEIISAAVLVGATAFLPYLNSITSELYDYIEGRYYTLGEDITGALDKLNVSEKVSANWTVTKEGKACSAEFNGVSLQDYHSKLMLALVGVKDAGVSEEDALYGAVKTFADKLAAIITKLPQNYDTGTISNDISKAHEDYIQALIINLKPQSFNCIMNIFVRARVANILGVSASQLPELDLGGEIGIGGGNGGDGEDNKGDGNNGGGWGTGDEKFGSNDLIYNPLTGEYVPYGELLKEYEAKMAEQADGLPQDIRSFMEEYFKLLYGGIKDETTDENGK